MTQNKPGTNPENKLFKYYPKDFSEPVVNVIHMDLEFDIYDDHTITDSHLHLESPKNPVKNLTLNAKNLEIQLVECSGHELTYEYDTENNLLNISFEDEIPAGTEFTVQTRTVCRPTANILEGLYYDVTPNGAPPQQITQCQQWGFQRIVPCIDEMTAKCTYTTKIKADGRYTNLISNGDISVPRHDIGNGRVSITYSNEITPMAPYLFFLGAGTYDTFTRESEYPDGKIFSLELLVPPGSSRSEAESALEILADGIMWMYLFTGPEQYHNTGTRQRMHELAKERDRLKFSAGNPDEINRIRTELAELSGTIHPGYQYTGTVYREIGMQNSDFGGMENVGNTTITTNRIMPFSQITDPAYEYLTRVKVHEFYHNLNGSEVTGQSPFEIWLNEAVTVFVEDQYHAFKFGEEYARLQTVIDLLAPGNGTMAYDRGTGSIPIEPDGFNDPNDLITGVTYVKSPEFVRMIETLMGKETFARALDRYHTEYSHGNATGKEWLKVMEDESSLDFSVMAEQWLKQTGYPEIKVSSDYSPEERQLLVKIDQSGQKEKDIWEFPFSITPVGRDSRDLTNITSWVKGRAEEIIINDIDEPEFVSYSRGYGVYGKVFTDTTPEKLILQAKNDSDVTNRFIAFYRLLDLEKMNAIKDPAHEISAGITDLYMELLRDENLIQKTGGLLLTIFESVDDESYAHNYRLMYDIKQKICGAVASRNYDELVGIYDKYSSQISAQTSGSSDPDSMIAGIKPRQVKNVVLTLLSSLDLPKVRDLAKEQFESSTNASDKLTAFACYLNSSAEDRIEIMEKFRADSMSHPVSREAFYAAVAGCSSDDTVKLVRILMNSPDFNIEQANDQRALFGRFAHNKKISLETDSGRKLLSEILKALIPVNEYSSVNILSVFGNLDRMAEEYQKPCVTLLLNALKSADKDTTPAVYNTIRRILIKSPVAVKSYEKSGGAIPVWLEKR
ncbi:M1 family metallopeptidase [Methanoplanus endosymbiosus]|uniref:M1 family metallopeptidase n=1 Tax=Methanoplanus endosymbiosus TaxID=33865 RepID=A0A9E7PLV9_9EURY|nr:M1 family metallopeptidase [Methanoplanus endosymbiosus]UUX92569.1 M1 family metallopeptidase [Methanoplanus endosymbiosus]